MPLGLPGHGSSERGLPRRLSLLRAMPGTGGIHGVSQSTMGVRIILSRNQTWLANPHQKWASKNPPTPAFAKAGAAPGTTAGVKPVPFPTFKRLKPSAAASTRHSGHSHLGLPQPSATITAFELAVCQPSNAQMLKIFRGSFDQALWPQAFVVRALKPVVCLHGPLFLGRSSLLFASPQMLKILRGSFDQALWPQAFVVRALQPAVCLHGPLFLGRSSLPFASPQMLKILRGSFDQTFWPCVVRVLQPAVCVHGPLFLGRSSLPFASPQMLKILRGSFDQTFWPQPCVVRVLQPAFCVHGPLFLGCSILPFASPQMLKILRGSFDQALWPQAFVVRALKPVVCLHGPQF